MTRINYTRHAHAQCDECAGTGEIARWGALVVCHCVPGWAVVNEQRRANRERALARAQSALTQPRDFARAFLVVVVVTALMVIAAAAA